LTIKVGGDETKPPATSKPKKPPDGKPRLLTRPKKPNKVQTANNIVEINSLSTTKTPVSKKRKREISRPPEPLDKSAAESPDLSAGNESEAPPKKPRKKKTIIEMPQSKDAAGKFSDMSSYNLELLHEFNH
jgi:hypothetical protein